MNVYGLLAQYLMREYLMREYLSTIWLVAFSLTPVIAEWLADAHIGRYRVIRCSVWIMWIATVLATVTSVIAQLIETYSRIDTGITGIICLHGYRI